MRFLKSVGIPDNTPVCPVLGATGAGRQGADREERELQRGYSNKSQPKEGPRVWPEGQRLTFHGNPFNMAKIHPIKDIEGCKIEDGRLKG